MPRFTVAFLWSKCPMSAGLAPGAPVLSAGPEERCDVTSRRSQIARESVLRRAFLVHAALVAGLVCILPALGWADARTGPQSRQAGEHHVLYDLTPAAAETRLALLDAAESGDIDELKAVAELNELRPDTGAGHGEDLAAYWRRTSADGHGRAVLSLVRLLLEQAPTIIRTGRDVENTVVFVWPDFAFTDLRSITISQAAHLAGLVGPESALRMRTIGRYDGWQISIGADGVWHRFRRAAD